VLSSVIVLLLRRSRFPKPGKENAALVVWVVGFFLDGPVTASYCNLGWSCISCCYCMEY